MTIKNQHQRKITAARLADFTATLAELENTEPADDNADIGQRLAIATTRSYIDDLTTELADYDALATAETIAIDSITDLGTALIQARIASGLTQAQLAARTGLQTAAITRYEATDYHTAKLERLAHIAQALDFDLNAQLQRQDTN